MDGAAQGECYRGRARWLGSVEVVCHLYNLSVDEFPVGNGISIGAASMACASRAPNLPRYRVGRGRARHDGNTGQRWYTPSSVLRVRRSELSSQITAAES